MGYEELQVRWMYSKLPETKAEVLKPLLPPESILLNVVLQRGPLGRVWYIDDNRCDL